MLITFIHVMSFEKGDIASLSLKMHQPNADLALTWAKKFSKPFTDISIYMPWTVIRSALSLIPL